MHFLYTRHLPSGEALHDIVEAVSERAAVRLAKALASRQGEDGRGGTVQLIDGAGRFLLERHSIDTYRPRGGWPRLDPPND